VSDVGNALRIPRFLSASSPRGLEQAMLKNNLQKSKEHKYFDISFDGKNWIVWFIEEVPVKGSDLLRSK